MTPKTLSKSWSAFRARLSWILPEYCFRLSMVLERLKAYNYDHFPRNKGRLNRHRPWVNGQNWDRKESESIRLGILNKTWTILLTERNSKLLLAFWRQNYGHFSCGTKVNIYLKKHGPLLDRQNIASIFSARISGQKTKLHFRQRQISTILTLKQVFEF